MKKGITICLLIATAFTVNAQQLSSGNYTVSISKVNDSIVSGQIFGKNYNSKETHGTYTIYKNGKKTMSQKFTFTIFNGRTIILNLKESDRGGNSIKYDEDTKMFEYAGHECKAKKTKTKEDIILSGILAFAQWLDEE
jgi:hypothetical protein